MIPRTSLEQLTPIADGGFGKVYRVGKFTLPGDTSPLAFKEFTKEKTAQSRSASTAVAFRDGLSSTDRANLDRYSAWPRAVVSDANGAVCGLLMPLISADFFCELYDAGKEERTSQPRQMGWLIASEQLRQEVQIDLLDVSYTDRLLLLAQLVYAIGWLHRHGWVFGDLSFRNIVFALDPPRIMLLDCDSAAAVSDSGRKQPSTPFWEPPEWQAEPGHQGLQDVMTDVYKLGLAILRCLTPGHGAASARNPRGIDNILDVEGARLIAAALSDDRSIRPTAKEVYAYLRATAAPRVAPPVIIMARVATPVVQQGQEAWVGWQVQGGGQVTVTAGMHVVAQMDMRVAEWGCAFRPVTPGPVRIEVTNPYGKAVADAGHVTLFEAPAVSVSIPDLPVPPIPASQPISLEPAFAAFPDVPDIRASVPQMPTVSVPGIGGLLPGGMPEVQFPLPPALAAGLSTIPWPDFHGAFIDTAAAISAWLMRQAEREVAEGGTGGQ